MRRLVRLLITVSSVLSAGWAGASPLVYVTHYYDGKVSLIDMGTGVSLATITVGGNPWGIAITPNGTRAYVANDTVSEIAVIDTASNTVSKSIPVGGRSRGIVVSPDGARVYVAV